MIYKKPFQVKICHRQRKDLGEAKCQSHEKSVQDVRNTITEMVNPFEVKQDELISLASGEVLHKTEADRLLSLEVIKSYKGKEISAKNERNFRTALGHGKNLRS